MENKEFNKVIIASKNGGMLQGYYRNGKLILRYVDLSLFLQSSNVEFQLLPEKKKDGKRITP